MAIARFLQCGADAADQSALSNDLLCSAAQRDAARSTNLPHRLMIEFLTRRLFVCPYIAGEPDGR
jgi:hypothetical protein